VRRATILIVILLAATALAACGKDKSLSGSAATAVTTATTPGTPATATATASTATTSTSTAPSTTTTTTAAATATTPVVPRSTNDGCEAVPAPQPLANPDRKPPRGKLDPKHSYTAVLTTNCGVIRILLAVPRSPKTTASFVALVRSRFYDGLTFHRIAKSGGQDFVIQGGDPLGTGNGGPGYTVVEKPSKHTRYIRGVVAMAKTADEAPGASGSQFFIVTGADAQLPPDYAVLGRVTAGQKAIHRIAALQTDAGEAPIDAVVIKTIRIVRR
jgi:peptidyl-prolyl cis-trans isomerase B (cyclophilin B)